jgi:hypothetical protein
LYREKSMKMPSVKALTTSFRDLTSEQAKLMTKLSRLVDDPLKLSTLMHNDSRLRATELYAESCYGDPFTSAMWRRTLVLHAFNSILGMHGVEALGEVKAGGPPHEYLNAGDTYATTLIYAKATDTALIGCWADIAEKECA